MKNIIFFFFAFWVSSFAFADGGEKYPEIKTNKKSLKEFQDLKYGLFVHWGPVSLRGTEISWSRGKQVPVTDYDSLYKEFDPVLFNADEWVKVIRDAGMKYIVFVTKHHDGFCLWDTEYTDYNIMNSPYGKDMLMELKNACEKYGIMFGTYYSVCDWYDPYYPLSNVKELDKPEADMAKYYQYMKDQTKELIEKYHTRILWFDGEWEKPWTHELGQDFYKYLKGLDDKVLINNRVDKGRKGMEGITISKKYAGDFSTPEQRIGAYDIENAWESCITICTQWAWKPNDKMKSYETLLKTLLKAVGGGGNFLLNVGPMLDGRIEQRQIDRLEQVGNWLKKYGDAVYGTTGGPYMPTDEMTSTRKENKIFLQLFNFDQKDIKVPLPKNVKVKSCSVMNGNELEFKHRSDELTIFLPENISTGIVLPLEIVINGDASEIPSYDLSIPTE